VLATARRAMIMDFMLTTIEFCYYEEDVMDVLMTILE